MVATLITILTIFILAMKLIDMLAVPVFLVFLVLKLCGVIAWSWVWVCFPLIVFAIAALLIIASAIILSLIGD
jgi:hypothetical protein